MKYPMNFSAQLNELKNKLTLVSSVLVFALSAAGLTSVLSGCAQEQQQKHAQLKWQASALSKLANAKAEVALQLNADIWMLADEDKGLTLFDANTNYVTHFPIQAEYLDVRQNDSTNTYAVLSWSGDSRLQLSQLDLGARTLTTAESQRFPYALEGICLYQTQQEGTQAFLLDESHVAHQVALTQDGNRLKVTTIRSLPIPPGAEYCAVDDTRNHVYVNEENVGVWRYDARAESMVKREAVDLVRNSADDIGGQLNRNSGPLVIAGDALWQAEKGGHHVHRYDLSGATKTSVYSLDNTVMLDGLSVWQDAAQVSVSVLDESTGQWLATQLPVASGANNATVKPTINHKTKEPIAIAVDMETAPVAKRGDAADDPAIWVNPHTPEQSRILGTNKKQGLYVYDLAGNEVQALLVGRVNNVDVRQGFTHQGNAFDIAAASQRERHAIALFKIHPQSGVVIPAEEIETTLDDVYGLCMSRGPAQEIFVFINDEDGRYEQWQIEDSAQGWRGKKVRSFAVASQPEGCTVDEISQRLFVGEEDKGIWTLGAKATDSTEMQLIAQVDANRANGLVDDVEGMEIYYGKDARYLVVSSQGDDSYLVYQSEPPFAPLLKFRLGMNINQGIDGASETDGLTVTSANLGARYPQGVMIAQDGRNLMPQENQNFKLADWRNIQTALDAAGSQH